MSTSGAGSPAPEYNRAPREMIDGVGLERETRARSFGSAADEYARYRPAPPAEAAQWAVGDSTGLVVDLAAGTGNLTGLLLGTVERVVAIDIDQRMLAALGTRLPGVARIAARGEELPVASGAAAGIVISSAWHWLDANRAWPEIARVIRPGGTFAVVRSGPDRRISWVADLLGARGGAMASGERNGRLGERPRFEPPPRAPFSQIEERTFEAAVPYEVMDLPGLAASFSRVMVLSAADRDSFKAHVAEWVASRPELSGATTVNLPLRCQVWRTVRT